MDFELSEEQRLLREMATRYLTDNYRFRERLTAAGGVRASGRDLWRALASLGIVGLPIGASYGGGGCGPPEVMIIAQCFGGALLKEPFVECSIVAAGLIDQLGADPQKADSLSRIATGECVVVPALFETRARSHPHTVTTRVEKNSSGWVVHGEKNYISFAGEADALLVSARSHGASHDAEGITMLWVPTNHPGVRMFHAATYDGRPVSRIEFDDCRLDDDALLGSVGDAGLAIEHWRDRAAATVSAEALGAMERVHAMTVEYLRTRQQFGQPLAQFQAVQHRLVDMLTEIEQLRSLVYLATLHDLDDPAGWARSVSCAKAYLSGAASVVGGQAIQLHGGMGMTDELDVSHYYKHLMAIEAIHGNGSWHRRRYMRLTA